ncbi:hypothetical protein D918_09611 [Trichuris suis]|nr:hypothetical protein D918_09611 [Trichuris suis]
MINPALRADVDLGYARLVISRTTFTVEEFQKSDDRTPSTLKQIVCAAIERMDNMVHKKRSDYFFIFDTPSNNTIQISVQFTWAEVTCQCRENEDSSPTFKLMAKNSSFYSHEDLLEFVSRRHELSLVK